ncbi:MAG: phosphoglycerate dehydrogenase [Crocinitomicaceae bacterium]|jgi:D-3-phosphoglycerate dehydrogenase|nr:phosphoglycerate dehydrogenase [Crocinitomicaceae bacterium]
MKIKVTSPSFSKHPELIKAMNEKFDDFVLNLEGKRYAGQELIDYLQDADIAIVGLEEMSANNLAQIPQLKLIAKYGVGLNNVDLDYCQANNIQIGWTGGVNRLSVAEMVLGNMLSLSRNLYSTSLEMKKGVWNKNGGFQLSGKTVGIIGLGHIGKEVVRLLAPFHCQILVNDLVYDEHFVTENQLIKATKEEIYQKADAITLHVPHNSETSWMIGKEQFKMMKAGAILINTSRGGIVREDALFQALKNKNIQAAFDVFEVEPPENQELINLDNFIPTPHIGGNAKEAVYAMGMSAIIHVENFLK